MDHLLLFAIFSPFLATSVVFLFSFLGLGHLGLVSMLGHGAAFGILSWIGWQFDLESTLLIHFEWVPSANINLYFLIDGLSLYFGLLASGMGILVNFYSNFYFKDKKTHLPLFYLYLNLFASSMLGAVFADNLLLMFIFWELTGVASFLLIGFDFEEEETSKTSRSIFLLITLASLFLFFGILLLGIEYGTFTWSKIAQAPIGLPSYTPWIIVCILIGIFGKSAQVPFHFWLPKAMTAPTPASAYLHAATMVKLGIYLTARMYPIFVNEPLWSEGLVAVSFLTMLIGSFLSLLSNDMKQILAYATVSQLGTFLAIYGIGTQSGVGYDLVHILSHALYKGSLFMLVGIIAHATETKDIRLIGGLWKRLPLTMVIFMIAIAAMIGIPGTIGFISKELLIQNIWTFSQNHLLGSLLFSILIASLIFKSAFSIRFFIHLFFDKEDHHQILHWKPCFWILVSPLILSVTALILGIWPFGLENLMKTFYVSGLHHEDLKTISATLTNEFTTLISIGIIVSGFCMYYTAEKIQAWTFAKRLPQFYTLWTRLIDGFAATNSQLHQKWLFLSPSGNLGLIIAAFVTIGFGSLALGITPHAILHRPERVLSVIAAIFLSVATLAVPCMQTWFAKLIALSISGFFVTLVYAIYKGPDLALTQLLVEVISIFIILPLFWKLLSQKSNTRNMRFHPLLRGILATLWGGTVALFAAGFRSPPFSPALSAIIETTAYELDHYVNVVNLILVDFRGFDTLGEITVLTATLLGVIGLISRMGYTPDKNLYKPIPLLDSPILSKTVPILFAAVNVLGLYLLLRGHHHPGGGFVGGLTAASAFILISLSYPQKRILDALRIDPLNLCPIGYAIAFLSTVVPIFAGAPFFSHHTVLGFLNTPLLFDCGVFLVVFSLSIFMVFSMRAMIFQERG